MAERRKQIKHRLRIREDYFAAKSLRATAPAFRTNFYVFEDGRVFEQAARADVNKLAAANSATGSGLRDGNN